MVEAPPLPGVIEQGAAPVAPAPPSPEVAKSDLIPAAYALLDRFSTEQIADLAIWMAERPMAGIDPIRLALASFDSLLDEEIVAFFEEVKNRLSPDLWELAVE